MRTSNCIGSTTWNRVHIAEFVTQLRSVGTNAGPVIIGVDGRGGAGKSTLVSRLTEAGSDIAVVHTDDIAWNHSFFGWDVLLAEHVLAPVRAGLMPVCYRPQAWERHGRAGAINVPDPTTLLLIEGTGSIRPELHDWFDATIWVDTPPAEAMKRLIDLDKDPPGFIDEWMIEENALLNATQPWTYATFTVSGTYSSSSDHVMVRP